MWSSMGSNKATTSTQQSGLLSAGQLSPNVEVLPIMSRKERDKQKYIAARNEDRQLGKIERPQLHPDHTEMYQASVTNNLFPLSFQKPLLPKEIQVQSFMSVPDIGSPIREPVLISCDTAIRRQLRFLPQENVIGMDLECNDTDFLQGRICLVQISTINDDFIVDPFCEFEMLKAVLQPVLTSESVLKVFCGGSNDFKCLQRDFHAVPAFCVDIQLLHNLLHNLPVKHPPKSLASLAKDYLNVSLKKGLGLRDWRRRPLTPDMVTYAKEDSFYCLAIYLEMLKQCECSEKLLSRAIAETHNVYQTYAPKRTRKEDSLLAGFQQNAQMHLMIMEWRTEVAKVIDQPAGRLLPDNLIRSLSSGAITNMDELLDLLQSERAELLGRHLKALLKILTGGEAAFNSMKKIDCRKCGTWLHLAIDCPLKKDNNVLKTYYLTHPEEKAKQNRRRALNKKRKREKEAAQQIADLPVAPKRSRLN